MIDDHHGRTAGRATLLASAMDEICTHNPTGILAGQSACRVRVSSPRRAEITRDPGY
jgi:hypothetical protein